MTFLVDSCALLSCRRFFSIFPVRAKFQCTVARRFHMDMRDEKKTNMEIINVPPIISTFRQALETFDDTNRKDLATNLTKLKSLMDTLKAEDLGFDKALSDPKTWTRTNKAPCTYIEVFQNSKINMSIFVLKPGFKMPLHDHPHMHGLLKVLHGGIKIRSLTEYPLKEAVNAIDFAMRAKHEMHRITQGVHKHRKLFAKVTSNTICSETSDTCVLTPTVSNYHEIEALEMPAAFFDILSPPYDTLIKDIGPRKCHYYKISNEISDSLVELQEMDVPDCFYCDQAPYLGPILSNGKYD